MYTLICLNFGLVLRKGGEMVVLSHKTSMSSCVFLTATLGVVLKLFIAVSELL